eukprot:TRINITY_DN3207_c0_g1_i2.p1 TRINITY_DN3207_c0_g1~~TRINITY_DN3207_c0_g1_i2.p1  ORF type:complete len:931 (-),score=211.56 TRINITY_DN3207_c0_g1_i2:60-2852(-)
MVDVCPVHVEQGSGATLLGRLARSDELSSCLRSTDMLARVVSEDNEETDDEYDEIGDEYDDADADEDVDTLRISSPRHRLGGRRVLSNTDIGDNIRKCVSTDNAFLALRRSADDVFDNTSPYSNCTSNSLGSLGINIDNNGEKRTAPHLKKSPRVRRLVVPRVELTKPNGRQITPKGLNLAISLSPSGHVILGDGNHTSILSPRVKKDDPLSKPPSITRGGAFSPHSPPLDSPPLSPILPRTSPTMSPHVSPRRRASTATYGVRTTSPRTPAVGTSPGIVTSPVPGLNAPGSSSPKENMKEKRKKKGSRLLMRKKIVSVPSSQQSPFLSSSSSLSSFSPSANVPDFDPKLLSSFLTIISNSRAVQAIMEEWMRNSSVTDAQRERYFSALCTVYQRQHCLVQLLKSSLQMTMSSTDSSVLLREESPATKLFGVYMQLVCSEYRKEALIPIVRKIVKLKDSQLDLEGRKGDLTPEQLSTNINRLLGIAQECFTNICSIGKMLPSQVKEIVLNLRDVACRCFNDNEEGEKAIGNLFFLRFFGPAIVSPEKHDVISAGVEITIPQRKALILISKLLQKLVNNLKFDSVPSPAASPASSPAGSPPSSPAPAPLWASEGGYMDKVNQFLNTSNKMALQEFWNDLMTLPATYDSERGCTMQPLSSPLSSSNRHKFATALWVLIDGVRSRLSDVWPRLIEIPEMQAPLVAMVSTSMDAMVNLRPVNKKEKPKSSSATSTHGLNAPMRQWDSWADIRLVSSRTDTSLAMSNIKSERSLSRSTPLDSPIITSSASSSAISVSPSASSVASQLGRRQVTVSAPTKRGVLKRTVSVPSYRSSPSLQRVYCGNSNINSNSNSNNNSGTINRLSPPSSPRNYRLSGPSSSRNVVESMREDSTKDSSDMGGGFRISARSRKGRRSTDSIESGQEIASSQPISRRN